MTRRDLYMLPIYQAQIMAAYEALSEINESLVSLESGGTDGDHVQTTKPASAMEEKIVRTLEKKKKIGAIVGRLAEKIREATQAIERVERTDYRIVLRCRFIRDMSQKETAEAMQTSQATVSRIEKKAIDELEETQKNRKKSQKLLHE